MSDRFPLWERDKSRFQSLLGRDLEAVLSGPFTGAHKNRDLPAVVDGSHCRVAINDGPIVH